MKTYGDETESWLANAGAPMRARQIYAKTAVSAGDTSDLSDYGVSSWADTSLQTASAFYRMAADRAFFPAVFNKRVGITSTPVGSIVDEGAATPLSPVSLQTMLISPLKAASLIICTNELLEDISNGGQQAFNRGLVNAVATAVDGAFAELIVNTATTSNPASGTTATHAWADLRQAALAVSAGGSSKVYVVTAPDVAIRLATLPTTDGAQAFVAAGPDGGEVMGRPMLVSAGLDPGSLLVINAAAIAAAAGQIDVRESRQGAVSMLDDPTMDSSTPTGATMVSLWQSNLTALMATAVFGAQALSGDAVAEVTSINWGG